jgi:Amino-terminal Zinc-binding domain of ubiquitin ligase E3A
MQIHLKSHEIMKQNLPVIPFLLCTNKVCGNPQNEKFPNPLQLCTLCFKPFWSARHDETNQRVPQKIIETYHQQLTFGCGREYCFNPYCCTSSDKSICKDGPLLPNDSALISVAQFKSSAIVKPKDPIYHFCNPDPVLQTRILLARRLQEMSESSYRLEYCVKALIECKEDITSALRWLAKNAPVVRVSPK